MHNTHHPKHKSTAPLTPSQELDEELARTFADLASTPSLKGRHHHSGAHLGIRALTEHRHRRTQTKHVNKKGIPA